MPSQRVSVWLNDVLVTDDVTLENHWEPGKPVYPAGQIELQSHSSPLYFRNILIREAPADEAAAAALRIKPGTPLVVLTELFYQHPARPICFSANAFLPASVRLEVIRRPTDG